jgi:L-ascorbate metabolism protein UlaG (beta-lactamase superfamily)
VANVGFTWLGHGGYRFDSAEGKRLYIDPWLENPKFPESERDLERVDVLVLTHGHNDHIANAVDICKQHSPKVVAIFELAGWLESQGAEGASALGMNKGGTVDVDGIKFTMTHALHSSGFGGGDRITYLGEAAGYVIEFENGLKVYCAGDTAVFGDMQLIGRLHSPDVAVLPIGDHFTMGPRQAALALELLGTTRCIPVHWGTFGLLTGTPAALREQASGVEVLDAEPGQTIQL